MSAREDLASYADRYGYTDEVNALLDAYRAEVLAEAIEAANAEYEAQDVTAERSPYNEGVFDAVSALYRLLNGGAR